MSDIQKNVSAIVIDDGSVKVPIQNMHGEEVGVFYFRPTDVGMLDRYNKIVQDFDKITEPLEQVSLNADGTTDENDEAQIAALQEAEKRLYDACDYMFGGNMSEAFFGKMNPFSPVGGGFYCENAINAVGAFIEKQFAEESQKAKQRIERYTHGVKTGKHKDGRK